MDLGQYSNGGFDRGRPALVEAAWIFTRAVVFSDLNPCNMLRVAALRMFGARVGRGVVVKPGAKVKFPWRLALGEHSWIGEDVWIDNLAAVSIGAHCCISQGAYLCTGNHDWRSTTFDLTVAPITIGARSWIAAKAVIGPGVHIGDEAVVTLGAVVTRDVPQRSVCRPAANAVQPLDSAATASSEPAEHEHG